MRDFTNRHVFITGGAQGIGLGMARAFAAAGARLALADVDRERLGAAEREVAAITGDTAAVTALELDVRDREGFAAAVDAAEERLGPIAVLCNNAGLGTLSTSGATADYAAWDRVLAVNVGGVINGVTTVLPRMIERGGPGHIVNTASGAGLCGTANLVYGTSKFAVVGLSESLRLQPDLLERGIGVSVLCPGLVRTDIIRNNAAAEGTQDLPIVEFGHKLLQQSGLDPDTVGEQVLAAVRSRALFVLTDRYIEPLITERQELLLAALPEETERDRELAGHLQARLPTLVPPYASDH